MLPGLTDLRNNRMKTGADDRLLDRADDSRRCASQGIVFDWVAERAASDAFIEAITPDSIVYLAQADSVGHFAVGPLASGHVPRARHDRPESQSQAGPQRGVGHGARRRAAGRRRSSCSPRRATRCRRASQAVALSDSVTLRVTFDRLLDPTQTLPDGELPSRRHRGQRRASRSPRCARRARSGDAQQALAAQARRLGAPRRLARRRRSRRRCRRRAAARTTPTAHRAQPSRPVHDAQRHRSRSRSHPSTTYRLSVTSVTRAERTRHRQRATLHHAEAATAAEAGQHDAARRRRPTPPTTPPRRRRRRRRARAHERRAPRPAERRCAARERRGARAARSPRRARSSSTRFARRSRTRARRRRPSRRTTRAWAAADRRAARRASRARRCGASSTRRASCCTRTSVAHRSPTSRSRRSRASPAATPISSSISTRGARGSRYVHCAALLRELTGAEDALVVNNCAAALVLALNTIADGREAILSRGELVEIGGSFRVHEIMAKSGARLREVGATNRTHLADYERAIGARDRRAPQGASQQLRRARASSPKRASRELAPVAATHGLPILHDLGSGLLMSARRRSG